MASALMQEAREQRLRKRAGGEAGGRLAGRLAGRLEHQGSWTDGAGHGRENAEWKPNIINGVCVCFF